MRFVRARRLHLVWEYTWADCVNADLCLCGRRVQQRQEMELCRPGRANLLDRETRRDMFMEAMLTTLAERPFVFTAPFECRMRLRRHTSSRSRSSRTSLQLRQLCTDMESTSCGSDWPCPPVPLVLAPSVITALFPNTWIQLPQLAGAFASVKISWSLVVPTGISESRQRPSRWTLAGTPVELIPLEDVIESILPALHSVHSRREHW